MTVQSIIFPAVDSEHCGSDAGFGAGIGPTEVSEDSSESPPPPQEVINKTLTKK